MANNEKPPSIVTPPVETTWSVHTEGTVKKRLEQLSLPFEAQVTSTVLDRIKMYVSSGRRETETILGRNVQYFPIFEYYLHKYNLPTELKYLPMIESGLRPRVQSDAGAVGIWQLMSVTARHFGLTINEYLDERRDPYRSTEAAVRLLSYLYDLFGDWQLVLIAYNGGHGRVQRAIDLAGCADYAEVRKYLPGETQRYIPYFVAATYIANYYGEHDLQPNYSSLQLSDTRLLEVHQYVSFRDIARVAGVDYNTINQLNPACLRGAVPRTRKGYYLVLPAGATDAVRQFLAEKDREVRENATPANSFRYTHVVEPGQNIKKIARIFRCSEEDIMRWNNLARSEVVVQQELQLFLSRNFVFNRA